MSDKKPLLPELSRIFELQEFLLKFHKIKRVIHHPGSKTKMESDTEHSYSLAMAAWFLAQYFPELNRDECIRFALVHDLVEIYAGDTFFYADEETLAKKAQQEHKALQQIKLEWPDFPEMINDIERYERRDCAESCFVYALDKIMPIIMIFLGKGHTWREKNITLQMLHDGKINKVSKSPRVAHYFQEILKLLEQYPEYFPDTKR